MPTGCATYVSPNTSLSGLADKKTIGTIFTPLCLFEVCAIDETGKFVSGLFSTDASGDVREVHNVSGSLCFEFQADGGDLCLINLDQMTRELTYCMTKKCGAN